eukprot:5363310-Prymnesium_polylepis.1
MIALAAPRWTKDRWRWSGSESRWRYRGMSMLPASPSSRWWRYCRGHPSWWRPGLWPGGLTIALAR